MTKRPVTDLTSKTQAVLTPSTVKQFLEANKLPHKEGHHAALPLTCPLCERETSQTVFINKLKTTGGRVCPPRKVLGEGRWHILPTTVSWSALVDRVHGAVVYIAMRVCAYVCVFVCV